MPGKYLIGVGPAQSNEVGSGPAGSKRRTAGFGAPFIDPQTASWWPTCIQAMGQRRKWLDVSNTGIGSTSLCDSWVGRCRTWASGMVIQRGTYVLSSGGVWRATASGASVVASTVAPAGTAETTGADGITWAYLGAPTASDVDGAVYGFGSSRYDPNGHIAATLNAIIARPGYDAKGIYVSIGQTDHSVGSTRSEYSAAMQAVAQHVTGLGLHCWLGVTCGMSGADAPTIAARDATMTGVVQAGRGDALAALLGNPLVHAGADLRAALGVPVASATDTTRNAVNNTDYLHLTSATYDQAGPFVAAAFEAGGW